MITSFGPEIQSSLYGFRKICVKILSLNIGNKVSKAHVEVRLILNVWRVSRAYLN